MYIILILGSIYICKSLIYIGKGLWGVECSLAVIGTGGPVK